MKRKAEYREFAKLYNEWIQVESLHKSPNTIVSYKKTMKLYIIDFLIEYKKFSKASIKISTILSKSIIYEWASWLVSERNNSLATRNLRVSNLVRFLRHLSLVDISYEIYYLEAKDIKLKKAVTKKVSALSQQAMEAVINAPNIKTQKGYRDHVLLAFMYATAGRINEVLSVKIKDINLRNIDKGESFVHFLGKGSKSRMMILLAPIVEQLRQYIMLFHGEHPFEEDYLFYTNNIGKRCKMSQKNVALMLRKYAAIARETCDDVPLDLHSHQFRHTRATIWLKEKHHLATVCRMLGHENPETTMRYLDITEDMIADAAREVRSDVANSMKPIWDKDTDITEYFDF